MSRRKDTAPPSAHRGYEVRDANLRAVYIAGGSVAALVVVALVVVRWSLVRLTPERPGHEPVPPVLAQGSRAPVGISLEEDPRERERIRKNREAEAARLATYGRDPLTQAIHIPVDRAMELLLARGLPVRQPIGPATKPAG